MYEIKMGFSHKNRLVYKSLIGGIFSILTFSVIFAYFVYLLSDVWNFKVQIQNSIRKRDLVFDETPILLDRTNFDFVVNWDYIGREEEISKHLFRYASISLQKTRVEWRETETNIDFVYDSEAYLELERCQNDTFNGDIAYLERLQIINRTYCPVDKNWVISGGSGSKNYSFFAIIIKECNQTQLDQFDPGYECATHEEQVAVINKISVYVTLMTQYFAGENKDNPILPNYEVYPFTVPTNLSSQTMIKIGLNDAILKDSWFSSAVGVKNISYTTSRTLQNYNRDYVKDDPQAPFMAVLFFLDENVNINQRIAFNVIDACGSLGGFASLIMTFTASIFYLIQKFHYVFQLLNQYYVLENNRSDDFNLSSYQGTSIYKQLKSIVPQTSVQRNEKVSTLVQSCLLKRNQFSQWTYFCTICNRKSQRVKVIERSIQNLYQEFSVQEFIEKIRTFDLYLDLQLLPYQKKVLQVLSKKRAIDLAQCPSFQSEKEDYTQSFNMLLDDTGSPQKNQRQFNSSIRQIIGIEKDEKKKSSIKRRQTHSQVRQNSVENEDVNDMNPMGLQFEQDLSSRVLIGEVQRKKKKSSRKVKKDIIQ